MSLLYTPSSDVITDTYIDPLTGDIITDTYVSSPLLSSTSPFMTSSSTILLTDSYTRSPLTTISSIPPLTINLDYSKPLISIYDTIDNSPDVREKMVNYFYDLLRDDWLLDDLNDILNYFVYRDGKVSMIKSLSDYNPTNIEKDTDKIAEEKVKYLTKNVISRYNVLEVLTKFVKGTQSKWVELPKNTFFLKQAFKEYIKKEIKRMLKKN